ncbi:hypothetical protein PT974_09726 [Cladobotryum mycophilum]|uniref:Uncharacterized protein n=1 Tax=Cladobotryum mycophilum TaxID=491253 RepID=A0ABR0SHF7_9HYPO
MDPSTHLDGPSQKQGDNSGHSAQGYYYGPVFYEQVPPPIPPSARRKKVKICLVILLSFIVVAVIILAVAAGLLVSRARHRISSNDRGQDQGPKPTTAITGQLDFPVLYPNVAFKSGLGCHAAWDALNSVPCHDRLFDRGADNGTFRLMGWDPMYYIPKICTTDCQSALKQARDQLSSKCSSADQFIVDGYQGMFDAKWLEAGPIAAVETLLRRTDYVCRASPTGDSDYQYCPVEMYERFSVTDGMNANLNGISDFIDTTNNKRVEMGRWVTGTKGTNKYSYNYHYQVRQQSYGPGEGETSCDWCTFNFLNHTLTSWTDGAVLNPDDKQPVSLPEFIRQVKKAGDRCAPTDSWDKIYEEAIIHYQSVGVLSKGWDEKLPSASS